MKSGESGVDPDPSALLARGLMMLAFLPVRGTVCPFGRVPQGTSQSNIRDCGGQWVSNKYLIIPISSIPISSIPISSIPISSIQCGLCNLCTCTVTCFMHVRPTLCTCCIIYAWDVMNYSLENLDKRKHILQ
jgi:hypothetical protein